MKPKGHILLINRVFPPDAGASGLRLMELCQGLAEQNWLVTVLTSRGRNTAPDNLHPNIRVKRLSFGSMDYKPSLLQNIMLQCGFFFRVLSMKRAHVTVTLTDPALLSLVTAFLKFFRRTKTVHWVHDLYPELYPVMGVRMRVFQPVLQAIAHWALRRHDMVVAIDDDMKAIIEKITGTPERVAMIPHWPDVEAALLNKRKPMRHDSDNPFVLEGMFTVLYSGNFGPLQNFEPLIEAMKIVDHSPHAVRFILAGDGTRFAEIRDRIEKMQLGNVHFMRAQPKDKFMDMLQAGDVHVSTLVPEAKGLMVPSKINSALGMSRPCVYIGATDTFQARLIKEYDAGVIVDPRDAHARFQIAEAVINYATSSDLYHQAQKNALQAAQAISFEKGVAMFDRVFTALRKRKPVSDVAEIISEERSA